MNKNEIYTFAKLKHTGQYRRDGKTPYFTHCEKVASLLESDFEKCVAYCHDLLEDYRCTADELNKYSPELLLLVRDMTKPEGIDYLTYIKYLPNRAKKIKIADIVANLSDSPSQKQIEKYNKALRILANV